jgi:hypothetical protein
LLVRGDQRLALRLRVAQPERVAEVETSIRGSSGRR